MGTELYQRLQKLAQQAEVKFCALCSRQRRARDSVTTAPAEHRSCLGTMAQKTHPAIPRWMEGRGHVPRPAQCLAGGFGSPHSAAPRAVPAESARHSIISIVYFKNALWILFYYKVQLGWVQRLTSSYSGGRDEKDRDLRPVRAKS
jgi:hypothetical protein